MLTRPAPKGVGILLKIMKVIPPITTNKSSVTFSRASTGTFRDRFGQFRSVGANVLRPSYSPIESTSNEFDAVFDGFLIEPRRTNWCLDTSDGFTPGVGGEPDYVTPRKMTGEKTIERNLTFGDTYLVLSFYGTGSVDVVGGGFTYSLQGKSDLSRVYTAFPRRARTFVIRFTGDVYAVNLEPLDGSILQGELDQATCTARVRPTSWIPTGSSIAATRETDIITGSGILYSDFSDSTAIWDSITPYSKGQRVRLGDVIYQSSIDSNTGNNPTEVGTTKWVRVGTSNDVALLDLVDGSTSSTANGTEGALFAYVLSTTNPNEVTNAVLVDVDAPVQELIVSTVTTAGTFSQSSSVSGTSSSSVYLEPPVLQSTASVSYSVLSFRLHNGVGSNGDMLNPSSNVSVAELVIGAEKNIGLTQSGLSVSISDFSVKQTNEFGITSWIRRGFSKKLSARVWVENSDYNSVLETFYDIRSTPAVWISTPDERFTSGAIIFGAFNDFSISIDYPGVSLCSLEIEGLVINN